MKAALSIVFFFGAVAAQAAPGASIPSAELRKIELTREPGLAVVDVRAFEAYAKGHIQGAKSIQAKDVGTAGLGRTGRIVVYCDRPGCLAAQGAAANLAAAGYENVQILDGGFGEWIKRGYPTEQGLPAAPAVQRGRVEVEEARGRLESGAEFAVDVRPAAEYAAGHLPRAYSAPLEELEKHYIDFPKGKEILVYDRLSTRSQQAFDKLKAAGFQVSELSGGIAGWVKKKRPLEVK